MTRRLSASDTSRIARAKRDLALERNEFRAPSVPRVSAAGVTSAPLKAPDPELQRMIADALAKRRVGT